LKFTRTKNKRMTYRPLAEIEIDRVLLIVTLFGNTNNRIFVFKNCDGENVRYGN